MEGFMWLRTLLTILILFQTAHGVAAQKISGREIIEEQQERHSSDHEFSNVSLTLVDRKGKKKSQEIMIYSMKKDGKNKTLIQYTAPAKIRGVGLLTWEQESDKEDDQWLYMSASKSIKRIAGGSKKNQFMGTDMAFEDMRPENLDAHTYELTGEEHLFNRKCWIVESVPATEKEKKESGYGLRIMWVDQSSYFTLKVNYFDHHNRHIKTVVFEDIRKLDKQLHRSFRVTWKRIRQKTSTIMNYKKIDIQTPQKDVVFTKNYMKRPVR